MPEIDPGHNAIRGFLRVLGPLMIVGGALLAVVGFASFFSSFTSFPGLGGGQIVSGNGFGPPRYFWCAFVGLPILVIGIGLTKFAYMGAVVRYVAEEIAPVGTDTLNYVAEETQDGIKTVAKAISEGIRGDEKEPLEAEGPACPKCGVRNRPQAKFCNSCGAALARKCPSCGADNGADAKFCDRCGEKLADAT